MQRFAGIPTDRRTHPAKTPAGCSRERIEHGLDRGAEFQVRVPHGRTAEALRTERAAVAHRRNAGNEFHLACRTQRLGTGRAVHRVAFGEHARDDAMAGGRVRRELPQQIGHVTTDPQVMVRVDDRQVGQQRRLANLVEPRLVRAAAVVEAVGHYVWSPL
jgi:hypothetical protein